MIQKSQYDSLVHASDSVMFVGENGWFCKVQSDG